ncbi:hypothetical protein RFI_34913, partial [Reticulomyxa filosa]
TLKVLNGVIKANKLTFSLCDVLKKDENEARIRELDEDIIDLPKLDLEMKKFVEYKKLADNFIIVLQRYLSTIPTELNAFYEFCRKLDDQYILDMEAKFEKEKNVLNDFSKEFQWLADQVNNGLFHSIWKRHMLNPISTIADIIGVFKQANFEWDYLITKIKNNTLRYDYLKIYTNIKPKEINILFSDPKLQEENIMPYLQNIKNAFCFLQTEAHWHLLKKATTIIQTAHKNKTIVNAANYEKQQNTDEKWQDFVKIIDQSEKTKQEATITEVSEWYLECQHYLDNISHKKDVLESICKNQQKIQDLATNEIFADQSQFEFAMQRMDDSQNEKFRHLAATLREVNQNMKAKIWDMDFQSIYDLAK